MPYQILRSVEAVPITNQGRPMCPEREAMMQLNVHDGFHVVTRAAMQRARDSRRHLLPKKFSVRAIYEDKNKPPVKWLVRREE